MIFRLRVEGGENVPLDGPLILASNHTSYLDPPAIGVACRRHVHFVAKKSLFDRMPARLLLSSLGAVPLDREKIDRVALSTSLGLLGDGRVLGIFPEGSRAASGLGQGQDGTAWLSIKARCPVVPVAVVRTDAVFSFMPRGITVRFGKPIEPLEPLVGGRRQRELVTARLMLEIRDLMVEHPVNVGAADG
ncbi:MAG: lysophospholipid acyltransferase family protein [Candidatus Geothermincolia bacterium]